MLSRVGGHTVRDVIAVLAQGGVRWPLVAVLAAVAVMGLGYVGMRAYGVRGASPGTNPGASFAGLWVLGYAGLAVALYFLVR